MLSERIVLRMLVELCKGKKTVGYKWVFPVMFHLDGIWERNKVIVVAMGYVQTYGIDYC